LLFKLNEIDQKVHSPSMPEKRQKSSLFLAATPHEHVVETAYQGHPLQEAELDGFYLAQVLWDESMAARAADAVRAGARQVVVLAGAGHIAAGRGIPQRVERRLGLNVLTVQPLTVDEDSVDRVIGQAIADADADILVVPRFEVEIAL
jgi:uncharacterized iron-regulated protein